MPESKGSRLTLCPITLAEARRFIAREHSHNRPPVGWIVGVGVMSEDTLVAVGVLGRPVSRTLQQGDPYLAEITRVATDRTRHACSKVYGALCRVASGLGYRHVITYTLVAEDATAVKAAGFTLDAADVGGQDWSSQTRHRVVVDLFGEATTPAGPKNRWIRSVA